MHLFVFFIRVISRNFFIGHSLIRMIIETANRTIRIYLFIALTTAILSDNLILELKDQSRYEAKRTKRRFN